MKRLIRKRDTKEFLTASGQWTRDHTLADNFPTDDGVRRAHREHRLENCELYYLIGEQPSMATDFWLSLERL